MNNQDASNPDKRNSEIPEENAIVSGPLGDLESLRLNQDFTSSVGLQRPTTTVPVCNPGKTQFIWVHPSANYRFETCVIEDKQEREIFLVKKDLWKDLAAEPAFGPRLLIMCMAKPGDVIFLWPIRLPGSDGRLDQWSRSKLEIAFQLANKSWTRITADHHLGAYRATVAPASAQWGEPLWPNITFQSLFETAFKDKFINDINHPKLKALRGEL